MRQANLYVRHKTITISGCRFLVVFVIVHVFVIGCKRGTKTEGAPMACKDSMKEYVAAGDTTVVVPTNVPDTVRYNNPNSYTFIHEEDSAEITNLRIFTRKQKEIYAPALLVGEWICGTEHEVYLSDGTGLMWDTSEDVSRDEAQRFHWSLDSNLLTLVCSLELGGYLPKRYVVTYVDDESLAYQDLYGKALLWDKRTEK